MEYKFTFEDGSESIMHYGVKGMKWHKHLKGSLYDEVLDSGQRSGSAEEFAGNLAGKVYDSTAKPYVDSAAAKANDTIKKYNRIMERERNLTDSERQALREKARAEKKARKKAEKEKLERLLFG